MLNNNSIINNINKVCNINNGAYVADSREVFQAALHCFYFMRPSQARDKFVEDLGYIFVDTLENAKAAKIRTKLQPSTGIQRGPKLASVKRLPKKNTVKPRV